MKLAEAMERFRKPKPAAPIVVASEPPEPATDPHPRGSDEFANAIQGAVDSEDDDLDDLDERIDLADLDAYCGGPSEEPGPFFRKSVAFSGKLFSSTRTDAMTKVTLRGGFIDDAVTPNTNFLVVGKARHMGRPTANYNRATAHIRRGSAMRIIDEDTFLGMLAEGG